MEVTIKGTADEIAALVFEVQERRAVEPRDPLEGLNLPESS